MAQDNNSNQHPGKPDLRDALGRFPRHSSRKGALAVGERLVIRGKSPNTRQYKFHPGRIKKDPGSKIHATDAV